MATTTTVHYSASLLNSPNEVKFSRDGILGTLLRTTYLWDLEGTNLKSPPYKEVTLVIERMSWTVHLCDGSTLYNAEASEWVKRWFPMHRVLAPLFERHAWDCLVGNVAINVQHKSLCVATLKRVFLLDESGRDGVISMLKDCLKRSAIPEDAWPTSVLEWHALLIDVG